MHKTNDHYAFFLSPHLIQMPLQYCFHNTKLKKSFLNALQISLHLMEL